MSRRTAEHHAETLATMRRLGGIAEGKPSHPREQVEEELRAALELQPVELLDEMLHIAAFPPDDPGTEDYPYASMIGFLRRERVRRALDEQDHETLDKIVSETLYQAFAGLFENSSLASPQPLSVGTPKWRMDADSGEDYGFTVEFSRTDRYSLYSL